MMWPDKVAKLYAVQDFDGRRCRRQGYRLGQIRHKTHVTDLPLEEQRSHTELVLCHRRRRRDS